MLLLLFIGMAIISLIKNIAIMENYNNYSFIIYDFIKNISYCNVYRLLIRYIVLKDTFIIIFGPIIFSELVLSLMNIYEYSKLNKLDKIIKILFLDLIKLFLICFILYLK